MASWTDQATQFRPYVQQLPVEAMLAVGVEKQRRYDEGIRKIQSAIDRVVGLDLMKDEDKNLLKSKLSELDTNLRTVAAGDFSNYQLVNTIGRNIGRISSDEGIQTAVNSTALARREMARMDKDREEGKLDPSNEYNFNKKLDAWLNDGKAGTSFKGTYIPYTDVWKKVKDIADQVGISSEDIQQLFQTDELGNTLYRDIKDPVTGKVTGKEPIWNPIMVEKVLKGKDAGKILSALETSLTPADYQQLAIEGEYTKASYTPEMLKEEINTNFEEQSDFYNDKIRALQIELTNVTEKNNKSDADKERIDSINKQLEYFNKSLSRLETSRNKNIRLADTNPDAVRASLYTNNYLHTMAKNLSSQDVSIKYSVSPMHTVTMDQNRFNLEVLRYKTSVSQWQIEEDRKEREFQHKMLMEAAKLKEENGVEFYDLPLTGGPTAAKDVFEERYNASVERGNELDRILAITSYKKTNKRNPNESVEQYEARISEQLIKDGGDDPQSYISKVASRYLEKGDVLPEFTDLVKEREMILKDNEVMKRQMEKVKAEAQAEGIARGLDLKSDAEILKSTGIKGKTIRVGGNLFTRGREVFLSAEDLLSFAYAAPGIFKSNARREKQAAERAKLKQKFGDDYDDILNKLYTSPGDIGRDTGIYTGIGDLDVGRLFNEIDYSEYKELGKIESEKYQEYGYLPQGRKIPIKRFKENRDDFNSEISALMRVYDGDLNRKNQLKDAQKAFMTDPDATVSVDAIPTGTGSNYELVVSSPKTGKEYRTKIDEGAYTSLTGASLIVSENKSPIISMLNLSGSTNLRDAGSPETSWFKESDFTGLKNYKARADYEVNEANPNIVYMKIYLYDKTGNMIDKLIFPDPKHTSDRLTLYDRTTGLYNRNLEVYPSVFTDEIIDAMRKKEE